MTQQVTCEMSFVIVVVFVFCTHEGSFRRVLQDLETQNTYQAHGNV